MHAGPDLEKLAASITGYARAYREEYTRFTAAEPGGEGCPLLPQSPFVTPGRLDCLVFRDGMLLCKCAFEPEGHWYAWGGPAIKIDYPHTRMPLRIRVMLGMRGTHRLPEGICRAITDHDLPEDVWFGRLGEPVDMVEQHVLPCCPLRIRSYRLARDEGLRRLTYGFLGDIIDPPPWFSGPAESPIEIGRDLGFIPADLNSRCFYNHLAVDGAAHPEVWDKRAQVSRLYRDVRHDYVRCVARCEYSDNDAFAQVSDHRLWMVRFRERRQRLETATDTLARLLNASSTITVSALSELLHRHSILIDPHGQPLTMASASPTDSTVDDRPVAGIARRPIHDYTLVYIPGETGLPSPVSAERLVEIAMITTTGHGYRVADKRASQGSLPAPRFRILTIDLPTAPASRSFCLLDTLPDAAGTRIETTCLTPDDWLHDLQSTCRRWETLERLLAA